MMARPTNAAAAAACGLCLLMMLAVSSVAVEAERTTPFSVVHETELMVNDVKAAQTKARTITVVNGPLILVGEGPFVGIFTDFAKIRSRARNIDASLGSTSPFHRQGDQRVVYDALVDFFQELHDLLNILIDKAALLKIAPLIGQPVAQRIDNLQGGVDNVAEAIIHVIPAFANVAIDAKNSLDGDFDRAEQTYSGLNV